MVSTDRSIRSVFVGNIPYDATEEKLKDIFCEVGPVQSFRLVCDRDTGDPKGYGFCEYKDAETAHSATRSMNNYKLFGQWLYVVQLATIHQMEEELAYKDKLLQQAESDRSELTSLMELLTNLLEISLSTASVIQKKLQKPLKITGLYFPLTLDCSGAVSAS